ncbi:hypothetical protein BRADI_3g38406v3 [Brachypodium distachyon]|uniref:Uncharacterized protein n=1 Tax=Brachypodium distachyon TaxID=15368 RepID=A0A0Q3QAG1_BRADI|nr:hypothetical protein BRADI_3g38406v3 [Brachypodium distachyon]
MRSLISEVRQEKYPNPKRTLRARSASVYVFQTAFLVYWVPGKISFAAESMTSDLCYFGILPGVCIGSVWDKRTKPSGCMHKTVVTIAICK